jgi:hypothetical protein
MRDWVIDECNFEKGYQAAAYGLEFIIHHLPAEVSQR